MPERSHNHITRDIKERGKCPACDYYWENIDRLNKIGPIS